MLFTMAELFFEKVHWTFRSIQWGLQVPPTAKSWDYTNYHSDELLFPQVRRILKVWNFLRPFFASRDYDLYYNTHRNAMELFPVSKSGLASVQQTYPYGRRMYDNDDDAIMLFHSPRVWGARDIQGRDVVIKLVSDASTPSQELKILQYLNTEPVRSDPRNHTILVVDYLNINGLIFAVMPRWDCAFNAEFDTVEEILHCAETFFEAFEFLHEHRIFHGDFLCQNSGYNACVNSLKDDILTGVRNPSETWYAIYDFGASTMFPKEISLEDAVDPQCPRIGWKLRGLEIPTEPYNPFQYDMLSLGIELQQHVRHLENIIPELGPFFDKLTTVHKPPSAQEALAEFRRIRSGLSPSQLSHEVTTRWWRRGEVITKAEFRLDLQELEIE
ncbi:hypothetical protein M413DRAFT_319948 [Hebeloma cylindrosporum]|uniref:Protein kinase domain-containing protein n=1 Tax=Hebeloma cylindrosporum TaxID=76867 RepID=A0A0C3BHU0_HEBCY|nr:hypothetical protein M413DRAFT_319948 [Hebeloma cylindrosporum h7]